MCKTPVLIRNPKSGIKGRREMLPVPCGKCKKCISSKILAWQFRLEKELECHSNSWFVTLTYNEDNVPLNNIIYEKGYPCRGDNVAFVQLVLKPRDITLYFKRLRKSGVEFKYFACGEYGSKTRRPHYHIICFGVDDPRVFQDCWQLGHVDVSPLCSIKSVAYTLKYLYKKDSYRPAGSPPFARMSKGLGKNYLTNEVLKFHNRKLENCTVTLRSGVIIPLPKYFKEKVYDDYSRWKLTQYLQARIDVREEERVLEVVRNSGLSEDVVRRSIDVEPFVDVNENRLCRPAIF